MLIRPFVILLCLALAHAGTPILFIDSSINKPQADVAQTLLDTDEDLCQVDDDPTVERPCREDESDEPDDSVARNPGLVDPVQRTLRASLARKSLVWSRTHRAMKPPHASPHPGWFTRKPLLRIRPITRLAVLAMPIQSHAPPGLV